MRKLNLTFAVVSILVGVYYFWGVRAAGYSFDWANRQPGYYNLLARGFVAGHLYLPVEPSPQLLAQPDPWDPDVDGSLKLFDAVLYHRRYYLYHGPGPAVMLFAPFRFLTQRDLPENFALALFCFGGFLLSGGALLGILKRAGVRPGMPLLAMMLLALGLCQCIPFLLSRVWVYELAIGGGYFCLAAAAFFFVRSLLSKRLWWLTASGFMFGMAVACRPHLVIAGVMTLVMIGATSSRKQVIAFAIPFIAAGASIAFYNFARFGNPLEFGNKWQLAGRNQGRLKLLPANVLPGLYYQLVAAPDFSPVFPWVEMPSPPRDFPRPKEYFVEQSVGALFLAPFTIGFPLIFFARRNRALLLFFLLAATGVLLFITMTGWSTQRYDVDFLPLLALATLGAFAEVVAKVPRRWHFALCGLLGVLIACGSIVNLALGISGPYWEMIKNKPVRFVKIAGWFSPFERHRPVLTQRLEASVSAIIIPEPDHRRQTWLTVARYPYRYELYLERDFGEAKLVSSYAGSLVSCDLKKGTQSAAFHVSYLAGTGEMLVTIEGVEILRHRIGPLLAAPSQIEAGPCCILEFPSVH